MRSGRYFGQCRFGSLLKNQRVECEITWVFRNPTLTSHQGFLIVLSKDLERQPLLVKLLEIRYLFNFQCFSTTCFMVTAYVSLCVHASIVHILTEFQMSFRHGSS